MVDIRASSLFGMINPTAPAYGAKMDGQVVFDAVVTGAVAGSMTVTSASGRFRSSDVGKLCVYLANTATQAFPRFGTITGFTSATVVTVSVNFAQTGTSMQFVWGSDDAAAMNAALADAKIARRGVILPAGMMTVGSKITIPTGVDVRGAGNTTTVDYARNFDYYGTSIVLLAYIAGGKFVQTGDTSLNARGGTGNHVGTNLSDLNIDALLLTLNTLTFIGGNSRGDHLNRVTVLRGVNESAMIGTSGVVTDCTFVGADQYQVVAMSGDVRFINNYVYGAGATYAAIKIDNTDVLCHDNHIWKNSDTVPTGPGILVSMGWGSGLPSHGMISIKGNSFDTSNGPHIQVNIFNNSEIRALSICDNLFFQNDSITNNTGPVIDIDIASGSQLRALTIVGNNGCGSWNDPTKGQYSEFVNGAGIAGNLYASSVVGNTIDQCNALYTSFTPTYTAGNSVIAANGTSVTTG